MEWLNEPINMYNTSHTYLYFMDENTKPTFLAIFTYIHRC
jgi:hypothetical protein